MMKWEAHYVLSRKTAIRATAYDNFALFTSKEALIETEVDANALKVLSYFVQPCSPRHAFERFGAELQVSEHDFRAALGQMAANGLLVLADKRERTAAPAQEGLRLAC